MRTMQNQRLTILGLAYNERGEIIDFSIYIGRKWLGSIKADGRFYTAKIGPAEGKGLDPDWAARQAWCNFLDWGSETGYGLERTFGFAPAEPQAVPVQERVTCRTTKRDGQGEPIKLDVYINAIKAGEVVKQRDGRFLAVIGENARTGAEPLPAARLAWIKSKGLI